MAKTSSSDDDGGLIADINVTPLVDITLVLLIIFMVAAPMIMNKAIKVNLPKSAQGKGTLPSPVALTIKKDLTVFLNGKAVKQLDDLEAYLRKRAAANPKVRAILSADAEVPHGVVVKYLSLLNRLKISRYAISVERPDPGPRKR